MWARCCLDYLAQLTPVLFLLCWCQFFFALFSFSEVDMGGSRYELSPTYARALFRHGAYVHPVNWRGAFAPVWVSRGGVRF